MDFKTVAIKYSDAVKATMEDRGIKEEDIREVLEYAEATGKKLYVEGEDRFLAKKRMEKFCPNVEYVVANGEVEVLNVYSYIIKPVDERAE